MSNSTSKPRRAMQLGTVLIAVAGLVATLTAHVSAQTTNTQGDRVEITEELCINSSLGGPITYPHDNTGDGIADLCSLPRTRRATAARQQAMERMANELALLFGHLFAQECLGVSETFGEPLAEQTDECAAPRQADFQGTSIPPVPASPIPEAILDSRYYSGPTITSPSFCINHSFGGPITYPHDVNDDGIADICSLPRTRRAAVARQNALERMAVDLKPRFDVLFAEECLRVPATLGEPLAEAEDECAVHRAGGTPLPTPGDPGTTDPGTTTPDDDSELPYIPAPQRPSDTRPPTYHDRAAQNVVLVPGNQLIEVTWAVPEEDDSTVFKYIVQWRTSGQSWSTTQQADTGTTTSHTITGLTNFITYQVRILAQRGVNDRYTPTLTATPGWSAPPTWPLRNALTNPVYGQVVVDWNAPDPDLLGINHYIIQWDTNSRFADNNNPFPRDCVRDTTCNEDQTTGAETTNTTYTINGLSNGTYYVRVQGVTSNGPGVWSFTQSIRLASTRLDPGQPTGITLTTAGTDANQLSVTWTPPATTAADPAPTHYLVQWRNIDLGQAFSATERQRTIDLSSLDASTNVDATANTVTTVFDSVRPRNEYGVRVQAINVDTPGRWSQEAKHEIGKAQPPTGISQDPGDGDLTITWNRPAGLPAVTSYFLQWGTSCSNAAFSTTRQATIQSTAETGVSHTIPSLTNNQRYYIRIQSINSLGSSDWSSCISGEPGTLNAPTGVTLADSDTDPRMLTVNWSYTRASDDVSKPHLSGFKIRYRRDGSTSWSTTRSLRLTVELKDQTGPYNYNLTNLTPGYEYEVQVLAQNSWGDGAWTASSTDTPGTQFIPASVSVAESTSNIRSLDVSWSAPSASANITGYRVQYRRHGSTSWATSSSSLADDATSHTITGLTTGVRHAIRVVARTASNGDGPGSDLDADQQPIPSAIPGQSFIPTAVVMAQAADVNGVHQLRISWTHSHSYPTTGTITYTVQYRTCASAVANCGGWSTGSASDRMFDIPVTSLRDDTYYQARVRANGSAIGGSSLYSDESSRWLVVIADQGTSDRTDDQITVTELQ